MKERGVKLEVLGMDGCSVNCGKHHGVFRCVEVEIGHPFQHVVCLLHGVELFFHHQFKDVDGMTLGPGTWLLHPQHLERIWIGQDQYRLLLAPPK